MEILKKQEGSTLSLSLVGRLDESTAPNLDKEIRGSTAGITTLVLDFSQLSYVSSAGLRVILAAQKLMNKQGQMFVRNVNDDVMKVFEMTGFNVILSID